MQKYEYLENKIKCMNEVEDYLWKQIDDIDFKFKAYKTSSFKSKEVIDKQTINNTTTISYDYDKRKNKNKVEVTEQVRNITKDIPHILKNINSPINKTSISAPLDEVNILIKQEMLFEDITYEKNESEEEEEEPKKSEPKEPIEFVEPKIESEIEPKVESKAEFKTDLCNEKVKKKHKNRNGKIRINKDNDYAYISTTVRKTCNNCDSTNHQTHMCKNPK